MSKPTFSHVWVYDDSIIIGPVAKIMGDYDKSMHDINIFEELSKVDARIARKSSGKIIIKPDIWNAILAYIESNQFAGLDLNEYLTRMFGV